MSVFFMDFDMAPSVIWARDLYDQMQIQSDFRKWFPRMCQYGFVEGRDYEFVPRVRPQDEGGRTVQRYVKDYRITLEMAKQLYKLHHFRKNGCFHPCTEPNCRETDHWMQAIIELLHAEFPVMGEFHDNLTLEQALEVYDKIPAERMNGIKSIGFSLEDGSIYSGMFDLMVGGEVQAEVVNHIQHYRESPLVQKAISDMKTLLEKRQASKELEERPNTRQSVREALKNRKKAQEQQSNQEQAKPKKAKKKGEMEL